MFDLKLVSIEDATLNSDIFPQEGNLQLPGGGDIGFAFSDYK